MGSEDRTQVTKLSSKCLYPLISFGSFLFGFLIEQSPLLALGILFHLVLIVSVVLFGQDRVSLRNPDWPGAHYIDQAGLELRAILLLLPLGFQICATMPIKFCCFGLGFV